ncbi:MULTISPECIES: hypothetical protein [Spirulina sp. CCY15215]|uniref:hypothetical protein n=1 Tax=Spirulina sp. CCY15215 TaxID=2767591 RepID=UPI001952347A|nr:hypothetical protein [Spirulina major]
MATSTTSQATALKVVVMAGWALSPAMVQAVMALARLMALRILCICSLLGMRQIICIALAVLLFLTLTRVFGRLVGF